MKKQQIDNIINKQRAFFKTGATLNISWRKTALKRLAKTIDKEEQRISEALKTDLGKSMEESYMCEIGMVKSEITYMIKHLASFMREKRVHTPLAQFLSRSFTKPMPYGNVLIMSPWNYPFLLALDPLVDAIAAGNTAVIKPSAYAPQTSEIIKHIIEETFDVEEVAVVTGGREENSALMKSDFKYIFFTGSKTVGREVMSAAADKLIPLTLELGGKSPCIVDKNANIPLAARRIVFGKFINCGQTCVAPDYIMCHKSVKERLLHELIKQIKTQYGENPIENPNYGKIINERHFNRIRALMTGSEIAYGGKCNEAELQIEPTILDDVTWQSPVMQEEIFGPLLPILEYNDIADVITTVNSNDEPLALYVFSEDKILTRRVISQIHFGGGCINDTIIHLATSEMGFGGVGASGMGSYHGRAGFDCFSHYKSIVDKKTIVDLPMRYQPYNEKNSKMIRFFLK